MIRCAICPRQGRRRRRRRQRRRRRLGTSELSHPFGGIEQGHPTHSRQLSEHRQRQESREHRHKDGVVYMVDDLPCAASPPQRKITCSNQPLFAVWVAQRGACDRNQHLPASAAALPRNLRAGSTPENPRPPRPSRCFSSSSSSSTSSSVFLALVFVHQVAHDLRHVYDPPAGCPLPRAVASAAMAVHVWHESLGDHC